MTIGSEQRAVQVWDNEGGQTPSDPANKPLTDYSRVRSAAQEVTETATRLIRRYPLQAFAGALLLGFVIGRVRS
jgi:hypothetical protein